MKRTLVFTGCLAASLLLARSIAATGDKPDAGKLGLEAGFENPPREARPQTWWHWMNGNISKPGITADLEAMKQMGLGGAQIFNVDGGIPVGNVKLVSPEWLDLYQFAAQECDRLGLKLGTHNCPGWSSSGGPWTTPEHGMQIVATSEVKAKGPSHFDAVIPEPGSNLPEGTPNAYHDLALLAYPTPAAEKIQLGDAAPDVTTSAAGVTAMLDGNHVGPVTFPAPTTSTPQFIQFDFKQPFSARQLILAPGKSGGATGKLEVSDDGKTFRTVKSFTLQRTPVRQNYTFRQNFPFPKVAAKIYRVTFTQANPANKPLVIDEAGLSPQLTLDNLTGKAFYQHSGDYHFSNETAPADAVVPQSAILDLTGKMAADGRLTWDVPAGDWTLLRIGYEPNGTTNHPTPAGGEGLECDKLSTEALDAHWAAMMGKIITTLGPLSGKALDTVEIDSYEVGSQNWTKHFRDEFRKRRGYDPLHFLPVFSGYIVDSIEVTDRFLWDLRRTVADLFAENYAGHMAELAHRNNLQFELEPYGDSPTDDLQYGAPADIPTTEFWVQKGLDGCTRLAASVAHTNGRKIVASEAFTAGEGGGNRWETDPYGLKALGDLLYCGGVNRFIFHTYTHQPWPNLAPGLTMGACGTHIERTNTWFRQSTAWILYLARCQWMLQQGLPVADVLFYAGEDTPSSSYGGSLKIPGLPDGYDFDACSTDTLLNKLAFKDGRFVLPDGMSYRLLVLPPKDTMTPQVLRRLKSFVEEGAPIIGPKPVKSPSLVDYPKCDAEVKQLADALWTPDPKNGRNISDQPVAAALAALHLKPDFTYTGTQANVVYTHRTTPEAEIYFVSNQKHVRDAIEATFRVSGKVPELWNAETGAIIKAPVYRESDGATTVPLSFKPAGSIFVVFRQPGTGDHLVAARQSDAKKAAAHPELAILKAGYGNFGDQKEIADVTNAVATWIKGGSHRIFAEDELAKGDPAPGAAKTLLVEYLVDGVPKCQAVPKGGVIELPQDFKLVRAVYGALDAAPSASSQVADVTAKLTGLIQDGTLNAMVAADLAGNDPAPAKPKELRVVYRYNGKETVAYAPEGQKLVLPGDDEAAVVAPAFELSTNPAGGVELKAWQAGTYNFTTAAGRTLEARVAAVPAPVEITGGWDLTFPPNWGAPPQLKLDKLVSWTDVPDKGVNYFSGTATYHKTIDIPAQLLAPGQSLYLDLGEVKNLAQVKLNGKDLGILWKPPFRADITTVAHPGANQLEIEITNLWPNRLIGDEQLPEDRQWKVGHVTTWPQWLLDGKPSPAGRFTFTTKHHWFKDEALLPSGLLGPVTLLSTKNQLLTDPTSH